MTLTTERSTVAPAEIDPPRPWSAPPSPSVLPTIVMGDGSVVALRTRTVIALGYLEERLAIESTPLVSALDLAGRPWWIPATAVWSDVEAGRHPQHPRPIGLAAGWSKEIALLTGLSDRLGWEANLLRERGRELPVLHGFGDEGSNGSIVYDGRLDHRVPTVVLVNGSVVRWGAGATLSAAYHRALYGDRGTVGHRAELEDLRSLLAAQQLDVVAVDLGTPLINRAGVERLSVQLAGPSHEPGRSWDADPVQ